MLSIIEESVSSLLQDNQCQQFSKIVSVFTLQKHRAVLVTMLKVRAVKNPIENWICDRQ